MAPHNPDLKSLVFWFWGTFKDNVYRNKPGSGEEFRLRVDLCVEEVPADTAESTSQMCFKHKSESAHFEHMRYAPKKRKPRNRVFINDAGNLREFEICLFKWCHIICQNVVYKLSKFHFRIFYQCWEISAEKCYTLFGPPCTCHRKWFASLFCVSAILPINLTTSFQFWRKLLFFLRKVTYFVLAKQIWIPYDFLKFPYEGKNLAAYAEEMPTTIYLQMETLKKSWRKVSISQGPLCVNRHSLPVVTIRPYGTATPWGVNRAPTSILRTSSCSGVAASCFLHARCCAQ